MQPYHHDIHGHETYLYHNIDIHKAYSDVFPMLYLDLNKDFTCTKIIYNNNDISFRLHILQN